MLTVSTFAAEVSVAGLAVSTFTVVSLVLFIDDDESVLTESASLPDFFPPHAANDSVSAQATRDNLIAFFMIVVLM